jgi:Flp pilus assembly protein TadG
MKRLACDIPCPSARRMVRRLSHDGAASLVEFAFSVSILLALIMGTMVMSLALYSFHYISNAAREGARYAMVRGSNCSTYGNLAADCPLASSSALQTYVRNLGFPIINTSNLTVTTTWSANGSTWASSPASKNLPNDYVKVVVTYTTPVNIPFVSSRNLSFSSTSVAVIAD